jgi:tRNA threonylcarbamoyladenosine biosynthesis protein TsaB
VIVLGIETATAVCGAAIVENGQVRAERSVEAQQVHSQKIMGLIDEVLRSTQLLLQRIDGIAISIGPGSFTGLRIGLSTAKGLAFALGKPVTAVSTLEALALNALRHANVNERALILPMIDARRDEVYAASYRQRKDGHEEVVPARAVELRELYEMLEGEELVVFAGDATEKFFRFVVATHSDQSQRFIRLPKEQAVCSAAAVGILGERQLERGVRSDVASLEPLYVKEFYTTMKPQPIGQH